MNANETRRQMIESQIMARGIKHPRVLASMARIPRERFVPCEDRERAYDDCPLPIGHGATISQPYIVALMTEAIDPKPGDRILEIGTGSGYQSALLAAMGAEVFTVEIIPELAARARKVLADLYDSVHFRVADGSKGWAVAAPFDAILVAAAPAEVPEMLIHQLKPGGRMVLPVGTVTQELIRVKRTASGLSRENLAAVRFVPLLSPESR